MALSLAPAVVSAQTQTERALNRVAAEATAFEEYYAGKCRSFIPSKGKIDARLQTLKDYAEKVKSDPGLCGNPPPSAPAPQPVIQTIKAVVNEPGVREEPVAPLKIAAEEPAVQPKAAEIVVISAPVVKEPEETNPEPIAVEVVEQVPAKAPEHQPDPEKSEPAKATGPATPALAKASEPAQNPEPPKITMSRECTILLNAIKGGSIKCNLGNYYDAKQCKDTSGNVMSAAFLGKCSACNGKNAKKDDYQTPCAPPAPAPAPAAKPSTPATAPAPTPVPKPAETSKPAATSTPTPAKPEEKPKPAAPVVETKPIVQVVVPAAPKCPMNPMTEADAKTTCKPFKGYCRGGIGLEESEKGKKEYTCDCSYWCTGPTRKTLKNLQ